MFPRHDVSHKTIFVLDENHHFVRALSGQPLDLDKPGIPPLNKSLWTSAVESITEYCRIVWDVFPDGQRVISFSRCRPNARPLLTWSPDDQTLGSLMKALIDTSKEVYDAKKTPDLTSGLRAAVSILSTETPYQAKFRGNRDRKKTKSLNGGRIVCVSYFKSEAEVHSLQQSVALFVEEEGLGSVELVLLNTHPMNRPTMIPPMPFKKITERLTSVVESSPAGSPLSSKVLSLVLLHYGLASTTVTGIPMKEEQNASSSANYDVEIVHPKLVHSDLYQTGVAEGIKIPKEGCEYYSIPLRWCTPRTSSVELIYTTVAVRLTPVDVNSRPSSCLTNFLLGGRTVMLEMPRKKTMSHMLSSHDNELYIHSLSFSRTILEDPPSISEGTGGRVTDYRINDFGMFMKLNKLTRCLMEDSSPVTPATRALQYLTRQTSYWPLVFSNSLVFNVQPQIQDLVDLIPKETLTPEDVNACKTCLYSVVSMESKGTPLPVLASGSSKGKGGPKRDEHYKMLFKELAHFVRVHATTPEHRQVLHSLLQLTNLEDESLPLPSNVTVSSLPTSMQVDPISDVSIPSTNKRPLENVQDLIPSRNESLLSFWKRKLVREESSRHPEFEGRKNNIPLYVNLLAKQEQVASTSN